MDLDSVLKQMRTEYTPDEKDKRRVESALTATLLAGSATGVAHLAASTGASVKGALAKGSLELLPLWVKGAVSIGATVATIGGAVYGVGEYRARRADTERGASSIEQHSLSTRENAAMRQAAQLNVNPIEVPEIVEAASAPPADGRAHVPSPKSAVAHPATARHAQGADHSRSAQQNPQLTSLRELQLLSEASRALHEGRPQDAQKALRDHEQRYTQSALGAERAGLTLLARCAGADAAVKAEAAKFLRLSSDSPLAARIKKECMK
jgi:hypothetical protein